MGSRITALAEGDPRVLLVARTGRDTVVDSLPATDVVIDFSMPDGAARAMAIAKRSGAALLVGTTGLSREITEELADFARSHAVMVAPNTSIGVAVLSHLVGEAARLLPREFDIAIVEEHHSAKRDAPSGTALRLSAAITTASGREVGAESIHAVRAGQIVGEHEVIFAGESQVVRLAHSALSRDVFAAGALFAARWLKGRPAGRYTIEQALGLTRSS